VAQLWRFSSSNAGELGLLPMELKIASPLRHWAFTIITNPRQASGVNDSRAAWTAVPSAR